MAWNTLDIGAQQQGAAWNTLDIGAQQQVPVVAGEAEGQIIGPFWSRILIPLLWLKQGKNNRRGFVKNTLLAMIGMR